MDEINQLSSEISQFNDMVQLIIYIAIVLVIVFILSIIITFIIVCRIHNETKKRNKNIEILNDKMVNLLSYDTLDNNDKNII